MKALVGTKEEITEEVIVAYNKMINTTPEYHSIETHNYYISIYGPGGCYLCNDGSKPVPKAIRQ